MSAPITPVVLLPISRTTRAKLEAFCAIHKLPDVDALAERILNEGLAELAHEDLIDLPPDPHFSNDYERALWMARSGGRP